MKKQTQRNYNISDSDSIEFSRTTVGNLNNYLTDFTAVDTTINQKFVDDLSALIDKAEQTLSDEVITDRQVQLTNALNKKMDECKSHYRLISYFAKNAFEDKPAIRNEFGENDYSNIKYSHQKMIIFMQTLITIIAKYKTELTKAGGSQAQLDKTTTLHEELSIANHDQELFMGNRPVLTSERIDNLNQIWQLISKVSDLSKIIYADDFAKLKLFLLPQRSASQKDSSITIEAQNTQIAIENGVHDNAYIKIENTGEVDLQFYVSNKMLEEAHENAFTLKPQESEILKSNDISNDTFGMLMTVNNTDEQGKFKTILLE